MSERCPRERFCRCGHAAIEHMDYFGHLSICLRCYDIVAHPCGCEGWVEDDTLSAIMALKSGQNGREERVDG
jgi:hypothetical protein